MTARHDFLFGRAEALADEPTDESGFLLDDPISADGDQLDREERAALRRVSGLSTELEDVTEVEYRQLRLERPDLDLARAGVALLERPHHRVGEAHQVHRVAETFALLLTR